MIDPRSLTRMQEQAGRRNTLRAGKTGTRLLDDSENNVGNSTIIQPQVLNGPAFTTIPQPTSNNSRLLNLTAESNKAQSITVVMTAAMVQEQLKFGGPITGVIEFGNGTQNTTISFDVPLGPFTGDQDGNVTPGTQPEDSGAIIQLPTSIIRAYARYDNAFVQPTLNGAAFGGPKNSPSGSDGPGYPLANPLSGPYAPNPSPAPVAVKAFTAYFGRIHAKLYKTQYLYCGSVGAKVSFSNGSLLVLYCVPPFAKSVRLIRNPISAAMTVELWNEVPCGLGNRVDAHYDIASNALSPIMPIEGNMQIIGVSSATNNAADNVSDVRLVYDIAF